MISEVRCGFVAGGPARWAPIVLQSLTSIRCKTAWPVSSINPSIHQTTQSTLTSQSTHAQVDTSMSGAIDFYDLLRVVEAQQARAEGFDDEGDMLDAFIACGGKADKTGHVRRETLVKVSSVWCGVGWCGGGAGVEWAD